MGTYVYPGEGMDMQYAHILSGPSGWDMGSAITQYTSIGGAAVDVDGDGYLDVINPNYVDGHDFTVPSRIHWGGPGGYSDLDSTALPSVGAQWACPGDFDNDGLLDLYQANGRVQLSPEPPSSDPYAEPNLLLQGVGAGRFAVVAPLGGTARPIFGTSRGAAFGDLDGDGGVDVVVVNRDGPAQVRIFGVLWVELYSNTYWMHGRDPFQSRGSTLGPTGNRQRRIIYGWQLIACIS